LILPYKDGLEVKGMGKNTYNYYSAYTPTAVHINGEFFGIYEMREKLNADYLVNNYGMDVDSIELLGVSYFKGMWLQPQIGTIDNYMADYEYFLTLDPESPGYLEDIASFLDLDNYTDYIIGESWIANTDWPQNNIKIFRCASTDYKWRFMLVDLEWALRPNEWSNSNTDHIAYMNSRAEENLYIIFWYRMMQTEEYRNRFINRFADLMNTNYHFDNLGIMEQEIYDEILPEMPKEYERWGGSNIELQMENFTKNHTTFRSELRNRSSRVRSHLKYHYDLDDHIYIDLDVSPPEAGRIKISTITPSEYPWRGTYFTDVPLAFEAIPNPGYIFNGWGESEYISDPDNPEFTSLITSKYNDITANFLSGSIEYDGITISEINYKDGSDFLSTDWFELHNSTDEDLNLEDWYFTDSDSTHIYTFGSGTLISSNDYLVIAKDLQIFSYKYPEVNNYTGGFLFDLSDHSDQINLYNPEGELMLSLKYSNHYPWPLSNLIDGSTLELLDPNKDLNDPENWIAGCIGGSPGKAYEKCNPNLSLDENKVIPAGGEIQNLLLYPNPIKDIFTLEFYAENSLSILELKLYDIYGRIVDMKSLENLSSGSHSITFENIESLKPQVYYMVLTTNKSRESIKIVVQ
jgi:hypothetical protein